MLVVTTICLSKGFQAWKDMVCSVGDKVTAHGMTFIFAGTQRDDGFKLPTLIHSESEAHFDRFMRDKELTRLRAEAEALVETGEFLLISEAALINYPRVLNTM